MSLLFVHDKIMILHCIRIYTIQTYHTHTYTHFSFICWLGHLSSKHMHVHKWILQRNLGSIISSKYRVIRIAPCSHLTSSQNYAHLRLTVGSQHLPPGAHVSLTDANESYACVLQAGRTPWMFFPTYRLKGWAEKQNISLLFIFITPALINQISCDEVQASHQHGCADREHV